MARRYCSIKPIECACTRTSTHAQGMRKHAGTRAHVHTGTHDTRTHGHGHTRARAHADTRTRTRTPTPTPTPTHTHTHTHTRAHAHANTQTGKHANILAAAVLLSLPFRTSCATWCHKRISERARRLRACSTQGAIITSSERWGLNSRRCPNFTSRSRLCLHDARDANDTEDFQARNASDLVDVGIHGLEGSHDVNYDLPKGSCLRQRSTFQGVSEAGSPSSEIRELPVQHSAWTTRFLPRS